MEKFCNLHVRLTQQELDAVRQIARDEDRKVATVIARLVRQALVARARAELVDLAPSCD